MGVWILSRTLRPISHQESDIECLAHPNRAAFPLLCCWQASRDVVGIAIDLPVAREEKGGMRMRGWLTELMIATLWFALFYFGRSEIEKFFVAQFGSLIQLLGLSFY